MKKGIGLLILLLSAFSVQAVEQMTYHLEQVSVMEPGNKYVFVSNETNRALIAEVIGGLLQTTDSYAISALSGMESYVWNVRQIQTFLYIRSNQSSYLQDANSKTPSSDVLLSQYYSTFYTFDFTDGLAALKTDNNKYLCSKNIGATGVEYQFFGIKQKNNQFRIYQLVPDAYQRPATGQLGTVCLPFTTLTATGADFYEIAYKEVDAQNNPTNITFQQVEGALQAGHPYVFDPTGDEITFTADPTQAVASSPLSINGLHGTFSTITDKETDDTKNKLVGQYMIYNNQVQLCGLGCSLNPNRAYIVASEVPEKDAVPAPTRKMMVVGDKTQPEYIDPTSGVMTDLQNNFDLLHQVNKVMIDGQLIVIKANKHFNLLGQEL